MKVWLFGEAELETTETFEVTIFTDSGTITGNPTATLTYAQTNMWPVLSGHSYNVEDTTENSGYVVTSNDCINMIPEPEDIMECTIVSSLIGAETTKAEKESTLVLLQGIVIENNAIANEKLAKAIEHVEKSLESKLWVDDEYLHHKDGKKVFHEEERAVEELLKIQNESDACTGVTEMSLKYIGEYDEVYFYNDSGLMQVPISDEAVPFGTSVVI